MTTDDLNQIQTLVNGAQRVLVLTHANPSVDAMGSALAIYLALLKMGKDVTVAMESQPLVEVSNLVGINNVKTSLSGKNLLITYKPYQLGDFEHVTYLGDETTGDTFKLTITPREGFTPDPKNFEFSYTGGSADLIFTVNTLEPAQLGALHDANLFGSVPVINIDNQDPNKDYGKFNLVEPDAVSCSEIVTFFLRAINAQLDTDIANNLYQGITQASSNFQSEKVTAATLEAAAICLRSGAKPMGTARRAEPMNNSIPMNPAPVNNVNVNQPQNQNIPEDWTQPKAYKGTSVI